MPTLPGSEHHYWRYAQVTALLQQCYQSGQPGEGQCCRQHLPDLGRHHVLAEQPHILLAGTALPGNNTQRRGEDFQHFCVPLVTIRSSPECWN